MLFTANIKQILGAAAMLIVMSAAPVVVTGQTSSDDQTSTRIATALGWFDRFQTSRSPEDLRKTAFELVKVADQRALRTGDVIGHRRSIVAAYAKVLQAADSLGDPSFDPDQRPSSCVTPPREPNGRQAPACAAPSDVLDPTARAQYEAAIDANSAKIRYFNAQMQIVSVTNETMSLLGIVLHRFHTRAADDAAALDDILRKSGISASRREQIHAMY